MKLEAGAGISGAKQFYLADSLSSCPLQKGNINYEAIGEESKAWIMTRPTP